MRRFIILSAAALLCIQAVAQNAAEQIKDLLANNRVSISYNYADAEGKELGKGLATVQGHCYKVIESGHLDSIIDNVTDLVMDGTRVSFKLTMQGIPEPLSCKATILRKTDFSEDLKDFRLDMVKYDRLWTITDLR